MSRRLVALIAPSRCSSSFPGRRLYDRRTRLLWPSGSTEIKEPDAARGLVEEVGLQVLEVRGPDVARCPEAMHPRTGRLPSQVQGDGYCRTPEYLRYLEPSAHADLHRRRCRKGWLERVRPTLPQVACAHNFAVLAERKDARA